MPVTGNCPVWALPAPVRMGRLVFSPEERKSKKSTIAFMAERGPLARASWSLRVAAERLLPKQADEIFLRQAPGPFSCPPLAIYRDARRHRAGPDPISTSLGLRPKSESSIGSSPGNRILHGRAILPIPAGAKINYFLYFFPCASSYAGRRSPAHRRRLPGGGRAGCSGAGGGIVVCSRPPS